MYARDFYPMMDYRATANCSTLFLFFPRPKNSDLVRDRRCGIFAFFLSLNVNTHRLWQNYRALYDPFYELNIFSSLVCGAVKHVDRNNIVRGYVYTRISAFSFFVSAATRKIRCRGRGRRYPCILRLYSFFFSFSNICAYRSSESFDPGSKQGCCFAQPVRFLPSMEIRVTRKYFPASRPGVRSVANKIKQSRLRVTF